jgi:hypothetical protein
MNMANLQLKLCIEMKNQSLDEMHHFDHLEITLSAATRVVCWRRIVYHLIEIVVFG